MGTLAAAWRALNRRAARRARETRWRAGRTLALLGRWLAWGRSAIVALLAVCLLLGSGSAHGQDAERAADQEPPEREKSEEGEPRFEAEFAASTIFQGGTVAVRSASPLTFEAHYFGVEDNEIGMVGLAWTFSRGALRVIPGVAWSFGSESRPAPVVTARWSYEHERWITQGLWVQSLRAHLPDHAEEHDGDPSAEEGEVRYGSILDGVHVSARFGRAELGPLVEHIQYREERSWKGGARAAWHIGGRFKIVGQVLAPEVEARAGFVWER